MLILAAATLPLVVGMWLFPSHLPNAPKMAGLAKQASDANKVSLKGNAERAFFVCCQDSMLFICCYQRCYDLCCFRCYSLYCSGTAK